MRAYVCFDDTDNIDAREARASSCAGTSRSCPKAALCGVVS
jgi:hypothetical protein